MKMSRVVCLGMAFGFATLAVAEKPPDSKQGLGQVEAILDYCAKVNPQAATKYKEHKKLLVGDTPDKDVAEIRKSDEYKQAYESVSGELSQASKDEAVKACTEFLPKK
jgi:hypothetical protein